MTQPRKTLLLLALLVTAGCDGASTSDAGGKPVEVTPASTDTDLYCKEHGVPEKFCTLCHEELKSKLQLCKEHGNIPEDICTLCHPEVEAKNKIEMCPNGHKLPKHFCFKCENKPAA